MPTSEAQKKANKKWKETNKESYYEKQRELSINYYYQHKDELLQKKKLYYQAKKAKKEQIEQEST